MSFPTSVYSVDYLYYNRDTGMAGLPLDETMGVFLDDFPNSSPVS